MSSSSSSARTLVVLGLFILGFAKSASAQDVDAMAKWTALTIVHYRVVGEFSGVSAVLIGTGKLERSAPVTDRVELEFDWDQLEMKLVGEVEPHAIHLS